MQGNYIKLDRKILEWGWYKNEHTKNVFIHCLLKANWKDGVFEGRKIPRGSFVTSISNLACELDLTNDEVRTAIKHLESTKEITKQITNRYTVISIVNYDTYQNVTEQIPSKSQPIPNPFPTIEERKKERKEEDIRVSNDTLRQTDVRLAIAKWNELSEFGIKPVTRVNSGTKRYDSLCARIREYGIEDVLNAIDRIKVSDFLQGKNNRGWTITFGWFVLPSNFPKVLEGDYDNREGGGDDGSSGKAGADEKEWNPEEHWGRFD